MTQARAVSHAQASLEKLVIQQRELQDSSTSFKARAKSKISKLKAEKAELQDALASTESLLKVYAEHHHNISVPEHLNPTLAETDAEWDVHPRSRSPPTAKPKQQTPRVPDSK